MVNKFSDKLSTVLQSSPENAEIKVHILYRRGLSANLKKDFLQRLANAIGKEEVKEILYGSDMIMCSTNVATVRSLADLPEIDWVDLESTAPIEDLLD